MKQPLFVRLQSLHPRRPQMIMRQTTILRSHRARRHRACRHWQLHLSSFILPCFMALQSCAQNCPFCWLRLLLTGQVEVWLGQLAQLGCLPGLRFPMQKYKQCAIYWSLDMSILLKMRSMPCYQALPFMLSCAIKQYTYKIDKKLAGIQNRYLLAYRHSTMDFSLASSIYLQGKRCRAVCQVVLLQVQILWDTTVVEVHNLV